MATASLYNGRPLPCISYLAQLYELPAVDVTERRALSWILRFPYTGASRAGFLNLWRWGGVKLCSVECFALASLVRAARFTLTSWRAQLSDLQASENCDDTLLPFPRLLFGDFPPPGWDTKAVCATLSAACAGFPARRPLAIHVIRALERARDEQKYCLLRGEGPRFKFQRFSMTNCFFVCFPTIWRPLLLSVPRCFVLRSSFLLRFSSSFVRSALHSRPRLPDKCCAPG